MIEDVCTCHLELFFTDVDDLSTGLTPRYVVIDAECVEVARCDKAEHAKLIAWALNKVAPPTDQSACLVHTHEPEPEQ